MRLRNKNEPILEPVLRELRFGVALPTIKRILSNHSKVLDYGCGPESKFLSYLSFKKIKIKTYCGFDPLMSASDWNKIKKQEFDLVTMFAVLEHLPYPDFNFEPITSRIKNGGYLLLTTPTKLAKPVLEFLSYKLGIVARREIEEHKHYFDLEEIGKVFRRYGLVVEEKKIFEMGMNNYVLLKKEK